MTRPPFYAGTAPERWLRSPRDAFTPAEYACAVERFGGKPARPIIKAVFAFAALAIIVPLLVAVVVRLV